ncbi:MAG: archease [Elusimicrobiales bacterium]
MSFEAFGTAGDAGLRAEAGTLELLLADLALGFAALSSPSEISPAAARQVALSAAGAGELAVKFLNELVYLADTAGFLPAGADIVIAKDGGELRLNAALRGEDSAFVRHPRGLLVKAATYHNLKIEERGGRWTAEVILDI